MIKKTLILAITLLIAFNSYSQLLWEITGKDLDKPSYLFGTHHAIPVVFLDSLPQLYKCYNQCSTVIGEVIINQEDMGQRLVAAASMPYKIDKYLTEDEYALVDSVMQEYLGFPLIYVENLRPSMISNMIGMAILEKLDTNLKTGGQMDTFFQEIGIEQNKPVFGLESVDDQIDLLFRSQSIERQAFLLVELVKEIDKVEQQSKELDFNYRSGNLEKLLQAYETDTTASAPTPGESFLLLESRNKTWADKLPDYMRQQPCFIAVGALHLPGKNGVIELLRKKGYKVKPVK